MNTCYVSALCWLFLIRWFLVILTQASAVSVTISVFFFLWETEITCPSHMGTEKELNLTPKDGRGVTTNEIMVIKTLNGAEDRPCYWAP